VYTLSAPFNIVNGKVSSITSVSKDIEQKILNVLVTMPIERIGVQGYGLGIQGLLFEPIDDLIEADIKTDAVLNISSQISGVDVVDITFRQDPLNASAVKVTVYYKTPLSTVQSSTYEINYGTLTEETGF
jgi:phage baseplate assembly protein W